MPPPLASASSLLHLHLHLLPLKFEADVNLTNPSPSKMSSCMFLSRVMRHSALFQLPAMVNNNNTACCYIEPTVTAHSACTYQWPVEVPHALCPCTCTQALATSTTTTTPVQMHDARVAIFFGGCSSSALCLVCVIVIEFVVCNASAHRTAPGTRYLSVSSNPGTDRAIQHRISPFCMASSIFLNRSLPCLPARRCGCLVFLLTIALPGW
jgi:hypothetical protein